MGPLGATATMAPHAFVLTKAACSVNERLTVLSIGRHLSFRSLKVDIRTRSLGCVE